VRAIAASLCLVALIALAGCARTQPKFMPWPLPDGPQARAIAGDPITLAWNASSSAQGYNIFTNGVKVGSATNLQFTFTQPAGRFTNEVSAFNLVGESARSAPLIWPPIPTNLVTIASVWVTNIYQLTGVTNWSITLTNPPGVRFYRHDITERTLP
jgi:hypothetical protein